MLHLLHITDVDTHTQEVKPHAARKELSARKELAEPFSHPDAPRNTSNSTAENMGGGAGKRAGERQRTAAFGY